MSGLKNLFEYAATGMSINQDIDSDLLTVTDIDRQNFSSNNIQKLVKEKKEPDLKISTPETIDIIIPFQKKSAADCPPIKLTFYNTTTKKNEEIEFYNYFQHLQMFGFVWEHFAISFRHSIELSTDKLKLIKKNYNEQNSKKKIICQRT